MSFVDLGSTWNIPVLLVLGLTLRFTRTLRPLILHPLPRQSLMRVAAFGLFSSYISASLSKTAALLTILAAPLGAVEDKWHQYLGLFLRI